MNLIPRDSLFDIDRFFESNWLPFGGSGLQAGSFTPRVDVKDSGNAYEISVELPGVDKKDIHVSLQNGVLKLEAETRQEKKEEKEGRVIRQERRYGKFVRSFDVGAQVQEKDITARFDNGILTLTAPKAKPEKESVKRIEIS